MKLLHLAPSLAVLIRFLFPLASTANAGSATWNLHPTGADWNTAANWTPATVPNGPTDIATFAASGTTSLRFSAEMTEVAEILFNPGASSFTITADSKLAQDNAILTISGLGISNNSGATQSLVAGPTVFGLGGAIEFRNAATAGDVTVLSALGSSTDGAFGGSEIHFYNTSTAGSATIFAEGAKGRDDAGGGEILFHDNATAADASFTATGSTAAGGSGGEVLFFDSSTASDAIFKTEDGSHGGFGGEVRFLNNSDAENAQFTISGGEVSFFNNSTASNATFVIDAGQVLFSAFDENKPTAANGLFIINGGNSSGDFSGAVTFSGGTGGNATFIANSGTNGGAGADINFLADDESDARFEIFGNATLTVFFHSSGTGEVTVGSLEGDGSVVLSTNQKLIIGNNNLSTTFSGPIQDFGSGSLGKVGTGTLTLTGANTYAHGTTVDAGRLVVENTTGSATGTGAVDINAGRLGGNGIIAGPVTVGTGSGPGAYLAPAIGNNAGATLTIQSALTFNADATYTYGFKARRNTARSDMVIANAVTIDSGARIALRGRTAGALEQGLTITLISNTSANPISGSFDNLPDGAIVTINNNNFQASYSGGDGNDLTLTVVP